MRRVVLASIVLCVSLSIARAQPPVSVKADTPFKLATFEAPAFAEASAGRQGATRVGLVLGSRVLDIAGADAHVAPRAGAKPAAMPADMRTLIETYDRVSPALYRIANFFKDDRQTAGLPFAFDVDKVSIKAPIKYPYNLIAAAANYRSHAGEMLGRGAQAAAVNAVDPDKADPVMFAKSPRSCIIDPGEPFFMPPGRNIDWEAELAIIIGRQAFHVPEARAHDYVFGYSIMYDVSDRGGTGRPLTAMFQGPNWFSGKSRDRAAPFGPFIVPKEFLPNHANLRIVTKVNGTVKQDGNSKDLIWDEARLVRYLTSILTLYPGDVISTGTPDGVGAARQPAEFLKPGDVVTIEIEGIGTLTTPMRAAPAPQ